MNGLDLIKMKYQDLFTISELTSSQQKGDNNQRTRSNTSNTLLKTLFMIGSFLRRQFICLIS